MTERSHLLTFPRRWCPKAICVVGLAGLWLGGATVAVAEGTPLDAVRRIAAAEANGTTYVSVEGSTAPLFTAYKLSQPDRVVIELARAHLSGAPESLEAGTRAVGTISAADLVAEGTSRTRIIIQLLRPSDYTVVSHGGQLLVTVTPIDAAAAASQETSAKQAAQADQEAERRAEQGRKEAQDEERSARAAAAEAQQERTAAESKVAAAQARKADVEAAIAQAERERVELAQKLASEQAQLVATGRSEQAIEAKADEARAAMAAAEARATAAEQARAKEESAARAAETERIQAESAAQAARQALATIDASRKESELAAARAERARRGAEDATAKANRLRDQGAEAKEQARADVEAKRTAQEAVRAREAARQAAEELAKAKAAAAAATAARESAEHHAQAAAIALKDATSARQQEEARRDRIAEEAAGAQASLEAARRARQAEESKLAELSAARESEEAELARLKGEEAAARKAADEAGSAASRSAKAVRAPANATPSLLPVPPKVEAATASPGTAAALRRMRVTDVRFADHPDVSEVAVTVSGGAQYVVAHPDPKHVRLLFRGATVPDSLRRRLDTSAFGGPVTAVSAYEAPDGGGVVDVELSQRDAERVRRSGDRVLIDFAKARRASAQSYPPREVSEFAGQTVAPGSAPAAGGAPPLFAQEPGPGGKVYRGAPVYLDFKDADIHNVLRTLSDVLNINFVVSDDVKGTVTIRLHDVQADEALDVILRSKGLGYVKEGPNIYRIELQDAIDKEREAQAARIASSAQVAPIVPRFVRLSYASAIKLQPKLQPLISSRGRLTVDERTNTVIIDDVDANGRLLEDLLHRLDTQTPAVMIEARIVEANTTYTRKLGIQWGGNFLGSQATGNPTGLMFPNSVGVGGGATDSVTPTAGLTPLAAQNPNFAVNLPAPVGTNEGGALGIALGSVSSNFNINLRLSALEDTDELRIVSAPKISALDNIPATISQGESIPIQVVSALGANTQFVDAVLSLSVTPHVTADGSILMHVNITKNEPDFANAGTAGPPILKKEATSDLLVRDGDTAVIGGIYTRNTGLSYHKVPWIADVPILGWFFKNRSDTDTRTEVLVFLTPHVLNYAQAVTAGQRAMGRPVP